MVQPLHALANIRRPPLVLYLSEEGHSCMRKAAELLGLGAAAIRTVPVDGDARMDVGALRRAVAADRAAGPLRSASARAPAPSGRARSIRSMRSPTCAPE